MKAYTSAARFDERRRFNYVAEEMGRPRLDSDANEQALIQRTDARRRSADVAEGSPDDGFLATELHLLDPVLSLAGWSVDGLEEDDERTIRQELTLTRRDPESLPHVVRARGATALRRTFPAPIDLLRRPIPYDPERRTFQAATVVLPIRFERPPTDDETVDIALAFIDADGTERAVAGVDPQVQAGEWRTITVPLAAFAAFPRNATDDGDALLVRGWALTDLPPRAELFADALTVRDDDLGEDDFILRGGDGTLAGAGRLFVEGRRTFLETDIRYSLQRDLPDPLPLERPADLADRHLVYIDIFDRPIHAFQDDFLAEPALAGETTTFRSQKVTQIRIAPLGPGASPLVPAPMGGGLLSTNVADLGLPDRFPPEDPDPCRDRCLFTENVSTGLGYIGKINAHMRVEIIHGGEGLAAPVIAWARDNAATVAPIVEDASADALSVVVAPEDAASFSVDDLVTVEDEASRLDPGRDGHRPVLRRLRAVNTATGRLEFFAGAMPLTDDPADLDVGGPLGRAFSRARIVAVRRWDGADWLLTDVRYNLRDGIDFAFAGADFRSGEYWTFTARIVDPDGGARGVVETLTRSPVHGPQRVRAPLALVEWTAESRRFIDLRRRFMPLESVRDRLIELGARHLSPGSFTIVVGDGVTTFGDIDQDTEEGVTGDEAIQTALARLGVGGGTIYIRAGTYTLEHAVLLQRRSGVRILGDGDGTKLRVTGAGGAFYLDYCGMEGAVGLELMSIEEAPEEETPFGSADPAPLEPPGLVLNLPDLPDLRRPLEPADLRIATAGDNALIPQLGLRLRLLPPSFGRAGGSVVRTLQSLRRRQREQPGVPLETSAPDELAVLQALPHGVISLADCRRVTLTRLTLVSRVPAGEPGSVAAGIFLSGTCRALTIADNVVRAAAGVVAQPYARRLASRAITLYPSSGLFLSDVLIDRNRIEGTANAREGVLIADGAAERVAILGNHVTGFATGIALSFRADGQRAGERSVIADNHLAAIRETGIAVAADDVDVKDNAVVLADGEADTARLGLALSGSRIRVTGGNVDLPPSGEGRDPLALEAGVLLGSPVSATGSTVRALSDVLVSAMAITGAGAGTLADGIVVASARPVHDVLIERNAVRGLGGAGVRVFGHAGPVGKITVRDNTFADLARANVNWTAAVIGGIVARAPQLEGIGENPTVTRPTDLLARLVALQPPSREAIDALLRFLDRASLRGAVVLTLCDGAVVVGNHISGVGQRTAAFGAIDIGAPLQTAGILSVGGRDHDVRDNVVESVVGVTRPIVFDPPAVRPLRPPIVEFLDASRFRPLASVTLSRTAPAASVHPTITALRRNVADVVVADAEGFAASRGALRLGVDAVTGPMRIVGGESAAAADTIAEAADVMLSARSDADARVGADALRAALSDAAALTAPDAETGALWSVIGAFDRASLGTPQSVAGQAAALADQVGGLSEEVRAAVPELADLAGAVADNPGDVEIRRKLAHSAGRIATALEVTTPRSREETLAVIATGGGRPATDSGDALADVNRLREAINGVLADLDAENARNVLGQASATFERLFALVGEVAPDTAERLRRTFGDLVAGRAEVNVASITRLRRQIQGALNALTSRLGEADDTTPGAAKPEGEEAPDDLKSRIAQRERFETVRLLTLAGAAVDSKLAEAAAIDPIDETFALRLSLDAARQLQRLTADDPDYGAGAEKAVASLEKAISVDDRDTRAALREDARIALYDLATGPKTDAPETAVEDIEAERIAALAQLPLELRAMTDGAARGEAVDLFAENLEQVGRALGTPPDVRDQNRRALQSARETLGADNPPAAARDGAIMTLADLARTAAADVSASAPTPELAATAKLAQIAHVALDPGRTEEERLADAKVRLSHALSPTLFADISNATTGAGLIDAVIGGMADLTLVPPLILPLLPRPEGLRLHPAEGVYAASVADRLEVTGNRIDLTRVGITVTTAEDHPLAPPNDRPSAVIVEDNRITRCATAALDVRPHGLASVVVRQNHASGCAGNAAPDAAPHGQSVLTVVGRGELMVAGNRLEENGNSAAAGLLHEATIEWQGDVTVRDNRVRHAGNGRGGCGVLILTGQIDAALVTRLATEPALVVEPAPQPQSTQPPAKPGNLVAPNLFELALAKTATTKTKDFAYGALALHDATERIVPSAATAQVRYLADTSNAERAATQWLALEAPQNPPVREIAPIVDFLERPPLLTIVTPPATRRSVSVTGNDVVADGPALLLLCNRTALVSASVTANELESAARCGAVYLRYVDQTVFAANRCEALREVNVAVMRCLAAPVTASANGIVGRERAVPAPKPVPKPFYQAGNLMAQPNATGPMLTLGIGGEAGLSIPIDAAMLLKELEDSGDRQVFELAANDAQSEYKVYAARAEIEPASRILRSDASFTPLRATVSETNGAPAREQPDPEALLSTIFKDPTLTNGGKLFAAAKFVQMSDTQAKFFVARQLEESGGDETVAFNRGVSVLSGDGSGAATAMAATNKSNAVFEKLVKTFVATKTPGKLYQPGYFAPRPLLPRVPGPREHSLVVIGGTRVAAVGNATTAGVYVHPGPDTVLLNI